FYAKDMEVCLDSAYLVNSVYNVVQSAFNNSTFQYIWPTDTGPQTFTVTIDDGHYDVDNGIQLYLEREMYNNKTYLLDATGTPVYFLRFNVNYFYNKITFTATPVPASLTGEYAGYTQPSGAPTLP